MMPMIEAKIEEAKKLLDEWVDAEHDIDRQRVDAITDLQKKIAEIQRARLDVRTKIEESIKLFEQWKRTAG